LIESLERRQLLAGTPLIVGGKSLDIAYHVALDSAGNRVVAGIFSGTVDFDSSAGENILSANGETDLYIAKYSATNQLIFARQYGGAAGEIQEDALFDTSQATVAEFENDAGPGYEGIGEWINTLIVGSDDSIYFGGSFQGTADFNPLNSTQGNIKSAGYQDGFVCKLDADGNTLWASAVAGIFDDVVKSIALDGNGNVAVTGYFTRYADFNPTKRTYQLNAVGRDDIFVQRLFGSTGKLDWVVTAGGDGVDIRDRDAGEGIAVDSGNNMIITGSFAGETDFAPGPGSRILEAVGRSDGFIWQLSPKGKMVRAQSFGGDQWDSGNRVVIDLSGNAYVAGYFSEDSDLDPTSAVQTFQPFENDDIDGTLTDIFALKQNASGDTAWIRQFSGGGFEYLGAMSLAGTSAIAIAGAFAGDLSIASEPTITSTLGDDGFEDSSRRDYSYDAFHTRLSTTSGDADSLSFLGSTSDDFGLGIADGEVLAGRFKGTVNFGTSADPLNRKSRQDDGFVLDI